MSGARHRGRSPLAAAAVAGALALGSMLAPLRAETPICDAASTVTPIGLDAGTGLTLLSVVAPADPAQRWIVAYLPGGAAALAYPDTVPGRYSGSVAAGPVVSVAPCGAGCLQPLAWKDGSWTPLGEPLSAPGTSSASATYDAGGTPWLLLEAAGEVSGTSQVWAYRLEGGEWRAQGSAVAAGLGAPSGAGSLAGSEGVALGTTLFAAGAAPTAWLQGLPSVPANRRGPLLRLGAADAAYLAADGVIYRTSDGGKRWQRATWTPGDVGGREGTTGSWRQGIDSSVDLPFGIQGATLDLAWFLRGGKDGEHLYLSRLTLPDRWETLADLPASIETKGPEPLPLTHVLRPKPDLWVLLFGCAGTAGGSGLVIRTLEGKTLSAASFLPIRLAGQP